MSEKAVFFLPADVANVGERLRRMLPLWDESKTVPAKQYVDDVLTLLDYIGVQNETFAAAQGIEVGSTITLGDLKGKEK